jgi:hypothetical protein
MSVLTTEQAAALVPIREALLADAQRDAASVIGVADADVDALRRATAEECERILQDARSRGEADAEQTLLEEQARTRRRARAVVLQARGAVYEHLRRRVQEAAADLADAPDYPLLRRRLVERAHAAVGVEARVTEAPGGGVVAEAGGRRAVLSLSALADEVLDLLGPDLERLWSP